MTAVLNISLLFVKRGTACTPSLENINYDVQLIIQTSFFFYWRYNPLWVCILQPSSGL
jgi:hypothetical protein